MSVDKTPMTSLFSSDAFQSSTSLMRVVYVLLIELLLPNTRNFLRWLTQTIAFDPIYDLKRHPKIALEGNTDFKLHLLT